ncbi:MAG: hypothetical protein SF182_06985 [Deltaproteobacteria bacterium]|nr:hypothetical protein [Deltaproteobacteria bacterium]
MQPSYRLRAAIYALIFAAALVGFIRRNDFSPVVHPDTAFEEALVRECLRDGTCTTLGGSASFRGVYHMVGWLNFRAAAEWFGLGRNATHLLIQFANAFGIVLVMFVSDRLGGLTAAALAPYFAFQTGAAPGALYDTSPMGFLGTVLLVLCVAAAVARPPLKIVALTTLTAAVIAEVHLAGTMAFLSVVWVVLLHPPGRGRRVALATILFVLAVLIISPSGLAWDIGQMVSGLSAPDASAARPMEALATRIHAAKEALIFLVPLILYRLLGARLGDPPRGLHGALAVCVPLTLAYSIGVLLGILPWTSFHYLEHAWAAKAVVLAVPIAGLASPVWNWLALRVRMAALPRRAMLWIVPLLLSLIAAVTQPGAMRPQPRWTDVHALARLLHDDWQWDWPTADAQLLSPEKQFVLGDLSAIEPDWKNDEGMVPRHPPEPVAVIAIETASLPNPLPSGWIVVSKRMFSTLLAIPTKSLLDWDDQTACIEDQRGNNTCFGPPVDAKLLWNLPSPAAEIRRFVRRVPWRGKEGAAELIVMPKLPLSCVGRIAQGPPGTEKDPDGRRARITSPGEVVFEWQPNTPNCGIWDFLKQDNPPFVLAGSPETVDVMSGLIDRDRR